MSRQWFVSTVRALRVGPGFTVSVRGESWRIVARYRDIVGVDGIPRVVIEWDDGSLPTTVHVAEPVLVKHYDPGLVNGPLRERRPAPAPAAREAVAL
ncbi:hypothetical protein [Streptomyces sp. NPDC001415]